MKAWIMTGCCCPGNCRRDYGLNKSFKIEYILEAFFRTGFQAPRSVDQTNFLTFFFFLPIYRKLDGVVCLNQMEKPEAPVLFELRPGGPLSRRSPAWNGEGWGTGQALNDSVYSSVKPKRWLPASLPRCTEMLISKDEGVGDLFHHEPCIPTSPPQPQRWCCSCRAHLVRLMTAQCTLIDA